jgi:hypothetical protein
MASLNANAVRIIIQAWTFGYPAPQPTMQDHLAQMVALAQHHGLRVQLTLFDWWSSYGDLSGSSQWAEAVLSPYAGDPRIACIELKNEINPADPAAMAWAQRMIPYVRHLAHGIPVTLSVSAGLATLRALVTALQSTPPDFYTYHYYGHYGGKDVADAYATLQQAEQIAAPTPLFVGETGLSTSATTAGSDSGPAGPAALEASQDHYYRTVDYATRALGLPPAAPWVLYDFAQGAIPPSGAAATPNEYSYGLYHTDGTAKPAAKSTAMFFGPGTVDTSFNNGFETGFQAGVVTLPTEWRLFHASQAAFARDTHMAHSGVASARISNSTGDNTGVPAFYLSPIDAHVVPRRSYAATAWVRGLNATGATDVTLAWFDASGAYLGQSESAVLPTGTTDWTLLSAKGVAPTGAAYVQIHLRSGHNRGTAWFDDVTFH